MWTWMISHLKIILSHVINRIKNRILQMYVNFTHLFICEISGLYVKVNLTCEIIISYVELKHITCKRQFDM